MEMTIVQTIKKYAKKYCIDAMSAMALGLFASLLIGTIFGTVGTYLGPEYIFNETKSTTRDMAILHYVDGLTLEETAKMMNMSVSGVRKRLSVLRNHAKQCVGE